MILPCPQHNDQAQPRRVSGVGWSGGLGGRQATAYGILCGFSQSVLVLLLHHLWFQPKLGLTFRADNVNRRNMDRAYPKFGKTVPLILSEPE